MTKIAGIVRLMRPINCAMMGFAVFVGAVIGSSNPYNINWFWIVYGFLTGFFLTAASMAINDYYDRKIDEINEPSRPIPSGSVSPMEAFFVVVILSVLGFSFAGLISILCLIVAVVSWIIVITYVTVGKRNGLPGNFLVSACVAIPFIYGSVAAVGMVAVNVWLFVSMAFLANTGREITKGIVDVTGDKAEGIRTLAVRFGKESAAIVAVVFYGLAVALSPVPVFTELVSWWFIPFVLVTDVGLIAGSVFLLANVERERARRVKNSVLLLFVFGLLGFVFGGLFR